LSMNFLETRLKGSFIIEPERMSDERGFFARTWCKREFSAHGLNSRLVQCNVSFNKKRGTVRGMHHQAAPREEAKIVRCTMGAIYDVLIDLRPDSPTFKEWFSVELTAENRKMIYIPEDFSHGFMTLADNSEVFYQMTEFYAPDCARGIRWNDPVFGIIWPENVTMISERDQHYPDFIA
jgi:dTDP-4-dehydrorhamnose 3,5-epimerase